MRPLAALLLALFFAGLPERGLARGLDVEALLTAPAQSQAALFRELKEGHARVDEALRLRKERYEAWRKAVERRDGAAAEVERMKRSGEAGRALEAALREALSLDEAATRARSQLMVAEAEVARRGASLLGVYEAVLRLERREIQSLGANDPRRAKKVQAYQRLAEQRDRVRAALRPVLESGAEVQGLGVEVRAQADDDIETLLEKADLARDLEERYLKRAALVRRRIAELEEERALVREVQSLSKSQALFDEEHRRLVVLSPDVRAAPSPSPPVAGSRTSVGAETGGASPPADSAPDTDAENVAGGAPEAPPDLSAGAGDEADFGAAPPPEDPALVDDGTRNDAPAAPALDVAGAPLPLPAEQAFIAAASEADMAVLLASGELSLPELRALEKRLREEAERMRKQSRALRQEVRERARR